MVYNFNRRQQTSRNTQPGLDSGFWLP